MKIYNKFLVNAKVRANELLKEYNRRTDGSSFKEWMENYLENLQEYIETKAYNNNIIINDYKKLLQETDANEDDDITVEETNIDRNGNNVKKIVTYSKKQMTKDILDAEDFNEKRVPFEFETRLGAYIYAKNKVDARPWYSKAFFFWRTYQESKMLDKMKQDLARDYEISEKQLDTMMTVINNNKELEKTEEISEGGYRILIQEERYEFREIKEAAKEVNISDNEKKIISDYVENEKELDDFDPDFLLTNNKELELMNEELDDDQIKFDKNDIISTNNKFFDGEKIEFNENEIKEEKSKYVEQDKTKLLRESLNEEFETNNNNISQKKLNKEDDIKINISIDKQ